eukprot:1762082-Heterocapsa_arctica.AAC.1
MESQHWGTAHGTLQFPGPSAPNLSSCGGNETGTGGQFRSALFSPRLGEQAWEISKGNVNQYLCFDSSLGFP